MPEYQGSRSNAFTLEAYHFQVFTKQALFFTSPVDTQCCLMVAGLGELSPTFFPEALPVECVQILVSHQVWLGRSLILITKQLSLWSSSG